MTSVESLKKIIKSKKVNKKKFSKIFSHRAPLLVNN